MFRSPVFLAIALAATLARADVLDRVFGVQETANALALNALGEGLDNAAWKQDRRALESFSSVLTDPAARVLWEKSLAEMPAAMPAETAEVARRAGEWRGRLQHVLALEMLAATREGRIEEAREWRAAIQLPKHASAVEGLLALQRMSGSSDQRELVSQVLAREYVIWQSTRVREQTDDLRRLAAQGRAVPALAMLRAGEAEALARFPGEILALAQQHGRPTGPTAASFEPPLLGASGVEAIVSWKTTLEAGLPDLLSEDDVTRRERLVLKLLRLVPFEYKNGVREGQVAVPIEYREAQLFTVQAQQLLAEVRPRWSVSKAEALKQQGATLDDRLGALESLIHAKAEFAQVDAAAQEIMGLLQDKFGLSLRKAGKGSDVVAETALEVRALLSQSLQAARSGQWQQADALRLEAYTTFDLEIEKRILPRDPTLATDAERRFLDGGNSGLGIKAVLDARERDSRLSAAYEHALSGLDECVALLKVGISPATVSFTAFTIVMREGLEAVVILAALLAGLRGAEDRTTRRRVVSGAWLAVAASVLTFVLSRGLIQSLSRHGEALEAVISLLAVIILLMVTNWVFHKFYWVGWNAKLRELKARAQGQRGERWESLSMIGVGFLTIYREGFETTLFLQSLILEGGWKAVLSGLAAGLAAIGVTGWSIFVFGARLPYRKLLVLTGILVVSILAMFLGSTVRLFQTVGWMPIHPIHGLEIPAWMGTWLGLYPSWEGILIPLGGFAYVSGAWLWVKWQSLRTEPENSAVAPSKAVLTRS